MNDWITPNQCVIANFVKEVKEYFGSPLTIQKINAKKFNGQNAWQYVTGSSIAELIDLSMRAHPQKLWS